MAMRITRYATQLRAARGCMCGEGSRMRCVSVGGLMQSARCTHACVMLLEAFKHAKACAHTMARAHMCASTRMNTHAHACTRMHTHARIYTYTRTQWTYTHTHTHTHTHIVRAWCECEACHTVQLRPRFRRFSATLQSRTAVCTCAWAAMAARMERCCYVLARARCLACAYL